MDNDNLLRKMVEDWHGLTAYPHAPTAPKGAIQAIAEWEKLSQGPLDCQTSRRKIIEAGNRLVSIIRLS